MIKHELGSYIYERDMEDTGPPQRKLDGAFVYFFIFVASGSGEASDGLGTSILNTAETKTSVLLWLTLGCREQTPFPLLSPPKMLQPQVPAPIWNGWQLSTAGALPPRAKEMTNDFLPRPLTLQALKSF